MKLGGGGSTGNGGGDKIQNPKIFICSAKKIKLNHFVLLFLHQSFAVNPHKGAYIALFLYQKRKPVVDHPKKYLEVCQVLTFANLF
uniref:Uncharacterized protein n=1 Tax=Meloidogyne enterolobii TaxID=390850 RepID=A0A6V7X0B2_MELEN|nr:unnamed protein product [Meloidogyne enterolobii]